MTDKRGSKVAMEMLTDNAKTLVIHITKLLITTDNALGTPKLQGI